PARNQLPCQPRYYCSGFIAFTWPSRKPMLQTPVWRSSGPHSDPDSNISIGAIHGEVPACWNRPFGRYFFAYGAYQSFPASPMQMVWAGFVTCARVTPGSMLPPNWVLKLPAEVVRPQSGYSLIPMPILVVAVQPAGARLGSTGALGQAIIWWFLVYGCTMSNQLILAPIRVWGESKT